jgi:SsrA-binding protein
VNSKKQNKEVTPEFLHITENRKARFNYHIIEKYEAGLVLTGNEIKSIRDGGISIDEAYVRPQQEEIYLLGAHIRAYKFCTDKEYNPTRPRKLLLNRSEINKLQGRVEAKGMTIVPLRVYVNKRGKAKIEIALAKGKDSPDKRKDIVSREKKREAERAMKR